MKREAETEWKEGDVAIIREGVMGEGKELKVLGPSIFQNQWWVPVNDPDEEDPTFFKEGCLRRKHQYFYIIGYTHKVMGVCTEASISHVRLERPQVSFKEISEQEFDEY